jgi:DNA-binding CsgD family transcriptional regulator
VDGDAQREDEESIPDLTKRQQQVLDLLVRGYSNPQIADALGISLDGAKWHVSEVMAKLGAESRQGAAERWRRHQRFGARVRRGLRALVPAALWAKVAVAGAVLVIGAGAFSVVISLGPSRGSTPRTAGAPFPVATYPADFFAGSNVACAGIGITRLKVSVSASGVRTADGAADGTPGPPPQELLLPQGFHAAVRDGVLAAVSGDGSVIIHDGDELVNMGGCVGADQLMIGAFGDPINVVRGTQVPDPEADASPTPYPVDAAIAWRKEFGLPADREYVEQVNADPSSTREFGVPLTKHEAAELNQRNNALQQVLGPLHEDIQSLSTFGGIYVDQTQGAHVVVLTTGEPAALDPVFARYADSGVTFDARHVQYTYAELLQLQDMISGQSEQLRGEGIDINQVGVDIKANRVTIGVTTLTASMASKLTAEFGPRVQVVEAEPAVAITGPPG